ncbi:MAG: oligosaccharide flippase family protein [Sporomusaceae bacterium]|nr:oligosaccharide flippase family protein [Sporomusaceae bacterium]
MMSATVFSQLLLLGTSPLLTRLYSPHDFGIFGLIMAYASVLSIVITGRYELAIMLPEDSIKAIHVVILTCAVTALFSVITLFGTVIVLHGSLFSSFAVFNELGNWVYAVPVIALLQSLYQALYFWFNRQQQYTMMARYRIWNGVLITGIALIMGLWPVLPNGLIVSQIVAYAVLLLGMGWKFWREIKQLNMAIEWGIITTQAKRYKDFPRFLVVAHSLESLSAQLPVIMLGELFGTAVAGYFTLTQRVIAAPIGFIAKAAGDIIRERFSTVYRKQGNCRNDYMGAVKGLSLIAVIPLTIFGLFGPSLFSAVFGADWTTSGIYAQVLAVMIFFQMIASPVSVLYMIAEKQRQELMLQIVRVTLCAAALEAGYLSFQNDIVSIIFFGVAMCLIYCFMIYQTNSWACPSVEAKIWRI